MSVTAIDTGVSRASGFGRGVVTAAVLLPGVVVVTAAPEAAVEEVPTAAAPEAAVALDPPAAASYTRGSELDTPSPRCTCVGRGRGEV